MWVLESIYEVDFKGFSYGYRPKRSQHNALDALYMALTVKKVSYVFETDIRGCYDHIDQQWLMRFLEHRITTAGYSNYSGRCCEQASLKMVNGPVAR